MYITIRAVASVPHKQWRYASIRTEARACWRSNANGCGREVWTPVRWCASCAAVAVVAVHAWWCYCVGAQVHVCACARICGSCALHHLIYIGDTRNSNETLPPPFTFNKKIGIWYHQRTGQCAILLGGLMSAGMAPILIEYFSFFCVIISPKKYAREVVGSAHPRSQ